MGEVVWFILGSIPLILITVGFVYLCKRFSINYVTFLQQSTLAFLLSIGLAYFFEFTGLPILHTLFGWFASYFLGSMLFMLGFIIHRQIIGLWLIFEGLLLVYFGLYDFIQSTYAIIFSMLGIAGGPYSPYSWLMPIIKTVVAFTITMIAFFIRFGMHKRCCLKKVR